MLISLTVNSQEEEKNNTFSSLLISPICLRIQGGKDGDTTLCEF